MDLLLSREIRADARSHPGHTRVRRKDYSDAARPGKSVQFAVGAASRGTAEGPGASYLV